MRYTILLLIILTCNKIVTSHTKTILIKARKLTDTHKYINRNKRDINISQNSDSFNVKATKDIFNDNDKILSVTGDIKGLKEGSYDGIDAGLSFADRYGDGFDIFALRDSTGNNKIAGKGIVNILKTDTQGLNADGFFEKDLSAKAFKYGGTLNYINTNGNRASIFAEHIPNFGNEIKASGKFNIFHGDDHNVAVSLGASRSFPSNSDYKNSNIYFGNLGYNYKDKFEANLGVKHSGASDRTDISLLGKLNVFPKSVGDLSVFATASKTGADSTFKPSFGITFQKDF